VVLAIVVVDVVVDELVADGAVVALVLPVEPPPPHAPKSTAASKAATDVRGIDTPCRKITRRSYQGDALRSRHGIWGQRGAVSHPEGVPRA
jgi:hypothetical protein